MLSLCRQTDERTHRRTTVTQYAPELLIQGHKKVYKSGQNLLESSCQKIKEITVASWYFDFESV